MNSHPTGPQQMVGYLRRQLIGPMGGPIETLEEAPAQRYLMGILFPQSAEQTEVLAEDVVDEGGGEAVEGGEDPISLANQYMPSSVGLSVLVRGAPRVQVKIDGARYEPVGTSWSRVPIEGEQLSIASGGRTRLLDKQPVLGSRGVLTSFWRPFGQDAHIVTLALVNDARSSGDFQADHALSLCQVRLEVTDGDGVIAPYPVNERPTFDDEEEELAYLYREVETFGIGHGCAVEWVETSSGRTRVWTEFLPSEEVPGIDFEIAGFDEVRRLGFLSTIADEPEVVLHELRRFAAAYATWIEEECAAVAVGDEMPSAAGRLRQRLQRAAARMDEGISLLQADEQVRHAFAGANLAMAMQMRHSRPDLGGSRRRLEDAVTVKVFDYTAFDELAWRPFQLAYLLLTLPSIANEKHADRELVDLIWFPTGGGKTEAYLGVVALQILLRRKRLGDAGAGTCVITRYTLRLLTTQQFQRAAALTCALELLRRGDPSLGTVPISIGIWVGGDTTPNRYRDAVDLLATLKENEQTTKGFQLEICPWCGTEVVPNTGHEDGRWGVAAENDGFRMWCPNVGCAFADQLPVSVVDDALYDRPPTFLIATVDKFARLAWDERPGRFLGSGEDPGPSLIIQDELHLISGPLGTVAALYEAAFDLVMRRHGARPKVLASTATIRRANEQVRGLFDRPVFLFPPSGMSAEDSYFVRADRSRPGRLYAGVMAQSHTPTSANVHTSAALLQGPAELSLDDSQRDGLSTLVAYHNSLRELGKTVTLMRDDIPARMSVIAATEDDLRELDADDDIIELTSNIPSALVPRYLERLQLPTSDAHSPAVVASTNMISVGVDVPRLGLMMVVGQPKTTSEYIQASSRVGRSVPGLVIALYSAAKPRDRSHYERFKAYHLTLYRQVEPTSVTPYALPARQRALHAAFVIVVRHALGLGSNDAARDFRDGDEVAGLIENLVDRVRQFDPREAAATEEHLKLLVQEWAQKVPRGAATGGLRYRATGRQEVGLLRRFMEPAADDWPTLDSMRNVDVECDVRVRGENLD